MTTSIDAFSLETVTDEALVALAAQGHVEALDELYQRHRRIAHRVAKRVAGNDEDAKDSVAEAFTRVFAVVSSGRLRRRACFRPYLLTTVRRVAIDRIRQRDRVEAAEKIESFDAVSTSQGPEDAVVRSEDGRLVLEAFKHLPERSQSVLWLVDVERRPAREAAESLGLTPNHVAQIAVRARGLLRRSYVEAHLVGTVEGRCRFTVDRLGSYFDGGLRQATLAKVDTHLSACAVCRSRVDQIRDAGFPMRRALLPVLVSRRLADVFRRRRSMESPMSPPARGRSRRRRSSPGHHRSGPTSRPSVRVRRPSTSSKASPSPHSCRKSSPVSLPAP